MEQELSKKNPEITVEQSAERPHHPTSPSKLQSSEWCPSYDNYEREVQHVMTVRGTAQHDVVETGEIPEEMTDEDAAMAMERRVYVETRIQQLLTQYPKVRMITEEYLPIDDKPHMHGFVGTTAGYLDSAIIFDDERLAEIDDWKFGNWAVEPAENNLQGLAYALGVVKRFPKLTQVTVRFHVPRVSKQPDTHVFSRRDLEEKARPRIEAVVSRAIAAKRMGDFAMARPGYPVCAFCAHIADCPKVASKISTVAKKYSPLTVPDEINPLLTLSKEDQTACMRLSHIVSAWAIAFKGRVKDRILEGKAKCPSDFILVSYVEREVKDKEKLMAVAAKHITKRKWYELKRALTPTLTQIERALRLRSKRGQKDAAVQALSEALLESGAVEKTRPVAFLRAKRSAQNSTTETTETKG